MSFWQSSFWKSLVNHRRTNTPDPSSLHRQLRLETLEDRRMLATLVVTNLDDGSLTSLMGDSQLSLREAIEAINIGAPVDGIAPHSGNFGSNDTIIFQDSLFNNGQQTLSLTAGQIEMSKSVTLIGPNSDLLSIDAQQNSRLFEITAESADFAITRLTLTGGKTTFQNQGGGAIHSESTGRLSILNAVITANAVVGRFSAGGAINARGDVVLVGSTINNNHTEGSSGGGGGIFAVGNVTLTDSVITDNRTEGNFASGAGISSAGLVTVNSSTISENRAMGTGSAAGGISGLLGVVIFQSTISGNQTVDNTGNGGGVSSLGSVTISFSTIVLNQALGANASGGGVWTATSDITVTNSIIANNTATGNYHDIHPGTGTLDVSFSLIGNAAGLGIPTLNNLLNWDPRLGPLSDGGSTQTHTPMPDSPVINGGAEILIFPPLNDQRGIPFKRIADGKGNDQLVIDMGSHEVQKPATADFDSDGDIDGADFLNWQRGYSSTQASLNDGNADDDTDVDNQDLAIWSYQFGQQSLLANSVQQSLPAQLVTPQQSESTSSDITNLMDLVIANGFTEEEESESRATNLPQPVFNFAANFAADSRQQAFATLDTAPQEKNIDALAAEQAGQASIDNEETLTDQLIVPTF